jgi:hypothetical protein
MGRARADQPVGELCSCHEIFISTLASIVEAFLSIQVHSLSLL